jgi:ribosome maturation factor RimP
MHLEEKLKELVPSHLPDQRYFLTEVIAKPAGSKTKISIFLDGDEGIDINVCAQVSRQVSKALDALNLLQDPYTLMVSSPGLDRPLKLVRQYHRNIGKSVKITLKNQEKIVGKLGEVTDEFVVIEVTDQQGQVKVEKIPFPDIESTHVLVSF